MHSNGDTSTFSNSPKRICVVGAGPMGLTAIKQFRDEGHDVTCYELNRGVGGIWYQDPQKTESFSVYDSAYLTISNKLMCFSDYQPDGGDFFYSQDQYARYLEEYASVFDLKKHCKFAHKVIQAVKTTGGGWDVTAQHVDLSQKTTEHFDILAVCTGAHAVSKVPSYPGMEEFGGQVFPSSGYKNNIPFVGKRVLIIGCGESSADIAREISDVASDAVLSFRKYPLLFSRLVNGTVSTSTQTARVHHALWPSTQSSGRKMPSWMESSVLTLGLCFLAVVMWLRELLMWYVFGRDVKLHVGRTTDHFGQALGEKRHSDINTEWSKELESLIITWKYLGGNLGRHSLLDFGTKNVTFVPNIINGRLNVNASGIMKVSGSSVIFNDGSTAENLDYIVTCTGFSYNFSFLHKSDANFNGDFRKLWKHCLSIDDPTLCFIGFSRPLTGGIPICAEMQARVLALVYAGKCLLPNNLKDIIETEDRAESHYIRHFSALTILIQSQINYLDGLATMIGCAPDPWKFMGDPALLWNMWTHGFNPAQYRLMGPQADYVAARKACMSMERAWSCFEILVMTFDGLFSPHAVKLSAVLWWWRAKAKIDVKRWSFGGKPRYPDFVLKQMALHAS